MSAQLYLGLRTIARIVSGHISLNGKSAVSADWCAADNDQANANSRPELVSCGPLLRGDDLPRP